jgi:hypothetical protein
MLFLECNTRTFWNKALSFLGPAFHFSMKERLFIEYDQRYFCMRRILFFECQPYLLGMIGDLLSATVD